MTAPDKKKYTKLHTKEVEWLKEQLFDRFQNGYIEKTMSSDERARLIDKAFEHAKGEAAELLAQIEYITEHVKLCMKACKPDESEMERGERLGYSTVLTIIKNSKNPERRAWDADLKKMKKEGKR